MKKLILQTMARFKKTFKGIFTASRKKITPQYKRFMIFAKRKPITAFLMLLGLLLSLIVLSNLINRPKPAEEKQGLTTKEVFVYTIGSSPKIKVQAQVEKSGVIKIVSLGSGVVQPYRHVYKLSRRKRIFPPKTTRPNTVSKCFGHISNPKRFNRKTKRDYK